MRLLGLDPGVNLGWCWGDVGGSKKSGTFRLPAADTLGPRLVSMERFIMELIDGAVVDKVYFEEPFLDFPRPGREPPPRSFKSETLRWGGPAYIAGACCKRGVNCYPVAVGTWRSGIGAPTQAPKQIQDNEERRQWLKKATGERLVKLGYSFASQDEADAIGIWLAMARKQEQKEAAPDLFARVNL